MLKTITIVSLAALMSACASNGITTGNEDYDQYCENVASVTKVAYKAKKSGVKRDRIKSIMSQAIGAQGLSEAASEHMRYVTSSTVDLVYAKDIEDIDDAADTVFKECTQSINEKLMVNE